MVFVVRTIKHSFLSRAGTLTYVAFFLAQARVILGINDCLGSKDGIGLHRGFPLPE